MGNDEQVHKISQHDDDVATIYKKNTESRHTPVFVHSLHTERYLK
jgi:hypothetical protein